MNNIDTVIDRANFKPEVKVQLKGLATKLMTCKSRVGKMAGEVYSTRSAVNERQFSERLRNLGKGSDSGSVILMQYACRNVFVNEVLRYYENFRQISGAAARIRDIVASLKGAHDCTDTDSANAIQVLALLADKNNLPTENLIGELDKVNGITGARLRQCVAEIYQHKQSGTGTYARANFSSQPIDVFMPTPSQVKLMAATEAAIEAFETYRPNGADFVFAKSALNRPQFTERLEAALCAGDSAKVEQIEAKQKAAEAEVYITGTRLLIAVEIFREQTRQFGETLKEAALAFKDDGSLKSLIAMSNWNGSWHWYREMEMMLENFERYHVRESLEDFYFEIGRGLPI